MVVEVVLAGSKLGIERLEVAKESGPIVFAGLAVVGVPGIEDLFKSGGHGARLQIDGLRVELAWKSLSVT